MLWFRNCTIFAKQPVHFAALGLLLVSLYQLPHFAQKYFGYRVAGGLEKKKKKSGLREIAKAARLPGQ